MSVKEKCQKFLTAMIWVLVALFLFILFLIFKNGVKVTLGWSG